jgi:tripartite-type tricarboxylate transporter receptor subunit TctC
MKNIKPRLLKTHIMLLALSFVLIISAASVFAAADSYPSKPVRLIIPFPPGGSPDIVGRIISTQLTERLGKQVIAENHSGAGGVLGSEIVAKSAPDGYTLLLVSAAYSINPAFYKLSFDPINDLVPVAGLGTGPSVLAVHPSVPANSVQELITLAKKQPGKLICVTSGFGSFPHLQSELFSMVAGIDLKIVHFKGLGPGVIDVMGGHSHMMFGTLVGTIPHMKSGKLKLLGITEKMRSPILPDLPTISEAGINYETTQWWGIIAPTGTPKEIISRLNKELMIILNSAGVKKVYEDLGAISELMGPAQFGKLLATEIAKWKKVVKEQNIKIEEGQ